MKPSSLEENGDPRQQSHHEAEHIWGNLLTSLLAEV